MICHLTKATDLSDYKRKLSSDESSFGRNPPTWIEALDAVYFFQAMQAPSISLKECLLFCAVPSGPSPTVGRFHQPSQLVAGHCLCPPTMIIMPSDGIFQIEPTEELIYRGEGNSSLVIALKSKRKVIRLLKSDAKKLKNDEDVRSLLLQHIDFNESILPDTLPRFFFWPPQLICLDHAQLEQIRTLVKDKRPSFRLGKTISNCDYALLMPDYCTIPKCISTFAFTSGPTLSIEIKPKQGFLPLLSLLNDPTLSIKSKVCRFGLSQFYKLQKQSITNVSSYCPLDLFSGCRTRAIHALFSLIESPQNNFRVFCDANLVYGDKIYGKSGNLERLQDVLTAFFSLEPTNGHANGFASRSNKSEENGNRMEESTNTVNGTAYRNGDVQQSDNVLALFCNLLLNSLYDDKIAQSKQKAEQQQQPQPPFSSKFSVVREFEKAKQHCNKPRFLRTFMQMFDSSIAPVPTPPLEPMTPITPNDVNNNQARAPTGHPLANGGNLAADVANNNKNGNGLFNESDGKPRCHFHQKGSMCRCSDSSRHCSMALPAGCVMDSILRAQKLDSLDSVNAVELFDKLCDQYSALKQAHYAPYSTMIDSFANEQYCALIEDFISSNLADLEKLWRFLISLTAKDCSIMVAMQRAEPNAATLASGLVTQGASVCTLLTEPLTGLHYVVSISITDLDFKQAYKIERSLHNDRRMIRAFWNAMRAESSALSAELKSTLQPL